MDFYDIYEQEINISLNDNDKYCKFKVVSMEEPTLIKKANDTNTTDNEETTTGNTTNNNTQTSSTTNNNASSSVTNTNSNNTSNKSSEKIDNYASSMSWTEHWSQGIKYQYPSIFNIVDESEIYNGDNLGKVATRISGVAVGVDPDTKERMEADLEIRVYEPRHTTEDINKFMYDSNGNKLGSFITGDGIRWYESYEGDYNKDYTEVYTHVETNGSGTTWVYKIEFETKGTYNYKVRNITNWLMGSTKLTSF